MLNFISDMWGIIIRPAKTIRHVKVEGNLLVALILSVLFAMANTVGAYIYPPSSTLGSLARVLLRFIVLWGPLFLITFSWFVPALFIHFAARIVRRQGLFLELLRVLAYPLVLVEFVTFFLGSVMLFSKSISLTSSAVLPAPVPYIEGVWFLFIGFLAVREVYEVESVSAATILVIGLIGLPLLTALLVTFAITTLRYFAWFL